MTATIQLVLIVLAAICGGILLGVWYGYVMGVRDAEANLAVELQDALDGPQSLREGGAL